MSTPPPTIKVAEDADGAPSAGADPIVSDAEIEAILASEGASPLEADQPAPQLGVARREPGQGSFGKWVAWLLIAFIVLGAINAYR